MGEQLIYKDLARYYDLIYEGMQKNYQQDVTKIEDLITKHKKSKGNTLLDVACGSGKHLIYFVKNFKCTGIDINKGILEIARKKLPNVEFVQSDMTELNLGKQFDVITCLFSSIGYVKTKANLQKTIQNFAEHLLPGGIAIIEPWFTEENYLTGTVHLSTYESENVKIARMNVSEKKGNVSIMDMHYLIGEKNQEIKHIIDRHELGMFDPETFKKYLQSAGLTVKYLKEGRGLYIGTKE